MYGVNINADTEPPSEQDELVSSIEDPDSRQWAEFHSLFSHPELPVLWKVCVLLCTNNQCQFPANL